MFIAIVYCKEMNLHDITADCLRPVHAGCLYQRYTMLLNFYGHALTSIPEELLCTSNVFPYYVHLILTLILITYWTVVVSSCLVAIKNYLLIIRILNGLFLSG